MYIAKTNLQNNTNQLFGYKDVTMFIDNAAITKIHTAIIGNNFLLMYKFVHYLAFSLLKYLKYKLLFTFTSNIIELV